MSSSVPIAFDPRNGTDLLIASIGLLLFATLLFLLRPRTEATARRADLEPANAAPPIAAEASGAPIRDGWGPVSSGAAVTVDSAERKRAEASLRESRAMLQLVLDSIPQGVFWKDRDSRFLGCNRVVAQAMGLAHPSEIRGMTHGELRSLKSEECEQFLRVDCEVMKSDRPRLHVIEPMTLADGSTIWLDTNKMPMHDSRGQVSGILGTWEDITERKHAEIELERNRNELQLILDTVPALIFYKDRDHRLLRVNSELVRLIGLSKEQIEGRTDAELGSPHAGQYYRDEEEILATGIAKRGIVEELYTTTGTRWLQTDKLPYRGPDGEIVGIIGLAVDITEQRKAEMEIRSLNAELEERVRDRTAKLEDANKELESFSYSISHDLRSPLRAINGFSKILLEEFAADLPPEAKGYLDDIRAGAIQMGRLIEDLLAFSRLGRQAVHRQEIDTAELVRECWWELAKAEPEREVEFQCGELPACHADRPLLKQVFVNLLSNARKYSSKREQAMVEVTSEATPDGPEFRVRDNGVGFDMRYAGKLFGVFHRLHRAEEYEGTGVGLAIVHRIVTRHGGRIAARHSVSPFLRRARPMDESIVEILLVEDNPDDVKLALHAFQKHKVSNSVHAVRDGAEALDFLFCSGPFAHRKADDHPKVVLLDLKLPKVDGLEVLRRVKSDPRTRMIPVVVMTSSQEESDLVESYHLGVNSYIVKPVDFDRFTEVVRHLGYYWLLLNQPPPAPKG